MLVITEYSQDDDGYVLPAGRRTHHGPYHHHYEAEAALEGLGAEPCDGILANVADGIVATWQGWVIWADNGEDFSRVFRITELPAGVSPRPLS